MNSQKTFYPSIVGFIIICIVLILSSLNYTNSSEMDYMFDLIKTFIIFFSLFFIIDRILILHQPITITTILTLMVIVLLNITKPSSYNQTYIAIIYEQLRR